MLLLGPVNLEHVSRMLGSPGNLLLQEVVDPSEVCLHPVVVVRLLSDGGESLGLNPAVNLLLLFLQLVHLFVVQLLVQGF